MVRENQFGIYLNSFYIDFNSDINSPLLIIIIQLQRYRPMLETDVFEYFPIGHDNATSALEGWTNNL